MGKDRHMICAEGNNCTITTCTNCVPGKSGLTYGTMVYDEEPFDLLSIFPEKPVKITPKFTPFHQQDDRRKEQYRYNRNKSK